MSDPTRIEEECARLAARIHKLSDMTQAHEVRLGEQGVLLAVNQQQLESIRVNAATQQQLTAAIATVTLKLENLHEDLAPIKRAMYWTVGLICASVLTALLALVIRGAVVP